MFGVGSGVCVTVIDWNTERFLINSMKSMRGKRGAVGGSVIRKQGNRGYFSL